MKQFFTQGTLGDAYTIVCKMINESDYIRLYHKTAHAHWYRKIEEIYSLLPNIDVTFTNIRHTSIPEITGIPEKGMEFFPEFTLPSVRQLKKPYIVVNAHAGRDNDAMSRHLSEEVIERIILKFKPMKTVLLGTLSRYSKIEGCLNLVGKTSITEAMSYIKGSSTFIGPEGLLCFVALSHKIPSVVFYVREQPINVRIKGNPWEEYVTKFIKM